MMPKTKHGLSPFECISALQKCIRRGLERQALEFALEMANSSQAYFTMMLNRLRVTAHEDIGLANPQAAIFTETTAAFCREFYLAGKGSWRLGLANIILFLSRSAKSREADHMQAAVNGRAELENFCPTMPDWAFDKHTWLGKKKGRGLEHFRTEGTKLIPDPGKDKYEDEAYEMWAKWEKSGKKPAAVPTGKFEAPKKNGGGNGNGGDAGLFDEEEEYHGEHK